MAAATEDLPCKTEQNLCILLSMPQWTMLLQAESVGRKAEVLGLLNQSTENGGLGMPEGSGIIGPSSMSSALDVTKSTRGMASALLPPLADLLKESAPLFVKRCLRSLKSASPALSKAASRFACDHICLRTSTWEEYVHRKRELDSFPGCVKLVESDIGGRPIATYLLPESMAVRIDMSDVDHGYGFGAGVGWGGQGRFGTPHEAQSGFLGTRVIRVLELPSPKKGRNYPSGWEHVEFAIATDEEMTDVAAALDAAVSSGTTEGYPELSEAALTSKAKKRLEELKAQLDAEDISLGSSGPIRFDERGMKKGGFNMDLRLDFEVSGAVEAESTGSSRAYPIDDREASTSALLPSFSVKLHWLPLELVVERETRVRE
ncbi:hypothetical protein HDU67_010135 [Dinochytrium kinnereticum]|nr:hypothetical protein HDU67_010135 [Dinochytrium kinnereticum]